MNPNFLKLIQNNWDKILNRFQHTQKDSLPAFLGSIKQKILNTPIPQPLIGPVENALNQARLQVARLQRPFFTAGYYGVKPWQVTPKMRVNVFAQEDRTPYGAPLPIASSETGYKPGDLLLSIPFGDSMEGRKGPLYSVSPRNLSGYISPQMPPDLIKFLPNALQEIKMRSEKLPPVRYKEQIPKRSISFKNIRGRIL